MKDRIIEPIIKFIIIAVLCTSYFGCQQQLDDQNIIARVGNTVVSKEEFELAYQFNPYLNSIKNNDRAVKLVLSTLIAQKIILNNADPHEIETAEIKQKVAQYRREAIIEKIWQDEIISHIEISPEEILEAYHKSKEKKIISYLIFENQEQAQKAFTQMKTDLSYEEVAFFSGYTPQTIPIDTVQFGSDFIELEKTAFNLKLFEVSEPIKLGSFYYIIKLVDEQKEMFTAADDFERSKRKIEKILRKRKSFNNFVRFFNQKVIEKIKYNLEREKFRQLIEFFEQAIDFKARDGSNSGLSVTDKFEKLKPPADDLMDETLVVFDDGENWDATILLQRLKLGPYPVDFSSAAAFKMSMLLATKRILDDELMVKYGKSNGVDNTDYVRTHTQMWHDYLRFKFLSNRIIKKHFKSDTVNARSKDKPAEQESNRLAMIIADYVAEKIDNHTIYLSAEYRQYANMERSDMVVFKTHFPKRTIGPAIQPLPLSTAVYSKIFKQ